MDSKSGDWDFQLKLIIPLFVQTTFNLQTHSIPKNAPSSSPQSIINTIPTNPPSSCLHFESSGSILKLLFSAQLSSSNWCHLFFSTFYFGNKKIKRTDDRFFLSSHHRRGTEKHWYSYQFSSVVLAASEHIKYHHIIGLVLVILLACVHQSLSLCVCTMYFLCPQLTNSVHTLYILCIST